MRRLALTTLLLTLALAPSSGAIELRPPGLPSAAELPQGDLDRGVALFEAGDLWGARAELLTLVKGRKVWGDRRLRAWFLLGWIHERLGQYQQASASYYVVRRKEAHPLREHAMFLEARADLRRGHPQTSLSECDAYLEAYADGRFIDECELIQADSHLALGHRTEASRRYEAFLDEHPDDQRGEAIALRLARALEEAGQLSRAASRYRRLYVRHKLPSTGRQAAEALERLGADGVEIPALDDNESYARACSLRTAGNYDASYELYCSLDARHDPDGEQASPLGRTLAEQRHDFLWRNRQYDQVAADRLALWKADEQAPGAPEHLFWAVQGLSRAGRFVEAAKYQEVGLARYPRHRRFRRSEERTALLHVGASQYRKAAAAMDRWMARTSRARRSSKVQFLTAYYRYRGGLLDVAIEELGRLAQRKGNKWATAARYYRGKAYDKLRDHRRARTDQSWILEEDPDSWYAVLLRNRALGAGSRHDRAPGRLRDGRWPDDHPSPPVPRRASPSSPLPEALAILAAGSHTSQGGPTCRQADVRRDADGRIVSRHLDGWGRVSLTGPRGDKLPSPRLGSRVVPPPPQVPSTWQESGYWDRARGAKLWKRFVEDHAAVWPDLEVAWEFSQIGLGEVGGPMVADIYREIRDARRSRSKRRAVARWRSRGGAGDRPELRRWAEAQDLNLKGEDWLHLFAAAGYPANVAAWAAETVPYKRTPRTTPEGRAAWTLRFPAAFAAHVWEASWANDVDPLLMLSLMRAESLYRHDAISHAGAVGLLQIMPPTAHRIASLLGERDFRIEQLTEPAVNIRLGTWYLGQLLRRFDGQFPLAVGSYNGGPHNVGRWLRSKVGMSFDEFVEEIAFDESRNYIKRVVGYYSIYADLYADGADVLLPTTTHPDDPSVIDF